MYYDYLSICERLRQQKRKLFRPVWIPNILAHFRAISFLPQLGVRQRFLEFRAISHGYGKCHALCFAKFEETPSWMSPGWHFQDGLESLRFYGFPIEIKVFITCDS